MAARLAADRAVSSTARDSFGRSDQILGYGVVHLPMAPGRHVLYVRTFRPVGSSLMNRFLAWLNGARPEFIDSLFPSRGAGRDVTRVQFSFGTVWLQVDVALQAREDGGARLLGAGHRGEARLAVRPLATPQAEASAY